MFEATGQRVPPVRRMPELSLSVPFKHDLRHVTTSRRSRQLHINVDLRPHIMLDLVTTQACAALQDEQRNLLDCARRAVGMYRRHRSGMAGVDRAQKRERFGAPQFANDDAVGAHAERGRKEIIGCDTCFAQFAPCGEQTDAIGMAHIEFGRILDQDQSLVVRDLANERIQKSCLARRGPARDQDVFPRQNGRRQQSRHVARVEKLGQPVIDSGYVGRVAPNCVVERPCLHIVGKRQMGRVKDLAADVGAEISSMAPSELHAFLAAIDLQVIIDGDAVKASVGPEQFARKLGVMAHGDGGTRCMIPMPCRLLRTGNEMRLAIAPSSPGAPTSRDGGLVALIAKAHRARNQLLGKGAPADVATAVSHRHLTRLARLSYLAPDIIMAILEGRQPRTMTSRSLLRVSSIPLGWDEQRAVLGIR